MGLFNTLKDKAIANRQRIILPEGTEPRTLQAANQVIADGIADIILIGNPEKIAEAANDLGLTHINEASIIDPDDAQTTEKYAQSPAEAVAMLTDYSCRMADQATARYKQLGEYLLVKFLDGNVKKEKDGKFLRNEYGMPENPNFPGYTPEYYRSVVRSSGDRLRVIQPEE